ncbi:MAG: AzlD domain-containing protein [Lactobacillales bacterium]|jgi:branched-subunit amino acid transport protein|nr:AzlD domain-containing protein [Lactobacillales bacterium]
MNGINSSVLIVILGSAVVTWIPRVFPFYVAKVSKFPRLFVAFLNYLPVCILCALLFQSVLTPHAYLLPNFKGLECLALVPTVFVAIRTKDLMKTAIVGIVAIALLRFLF